MTTLYPGALDSYSTKVDGVDDVMAEDINDPQDAIEALEAQHQKRSLRKIKNGSGATVAVNKIGYFDVAGDFKTTTTASLLASPWAAVISGGANNTQIVVGQGRVTIELTANCSIGDFLISSTTAGRAGVVAAWEAAALAVALTANTSGAGGTCEAMLFPEIGFWVGFGVVVDEVRARNGDLALGDTVGGGDVDVNINDGQFFVQGSDGSIHIGGTSPGRPFTIENADGSGNLIVSIVSSPTGGGFFDFSDSPGGLGLNGGRIEYDHNTDRFEFITNGSAAAKMTIDSVGRVGLGTVTPPSRLTVGAGAIEGSEMTDPTAGAANTYRIFAEDNGAGKTRLMVRFASGAAQQIAIEP
ncbi:hypothetical protein LCGC14_0561740 [marine sediment metagenome]|uniref:Uncharacterized protein n=1 Tax=marine sediment metagenome TaxID=412755 RepID=A0A0F9S5E9_9ZZZZ